MEDSEILQNLRMAQEDSKWFSDKYKELRAKYEDKVLAIKDKNVIGSADSIEELLGKVQSKGENIALLLIETIPPKDVSFIL
jgi:hypothetical protein